MKKEEDNQNNFKEEKIEKEEEKIKTSSMYKKSEKIYEDADFCDIADFRDSIGLGEFPTS